MQRDYTGRKRYQSWGDTELKYYCNSIVQREGICTLAKTAVRQTNKVYMSKLDVTLGILFPSMISEIVNGNSKSIPARCFCRVVSALVGTQSGFLSSSHHPGHG